MPFLISIDPGEKRTGFCLFHYKEGEIGADLRMKSRAENKDDYMVILRAATRLADSTPISHVVCENYRIRPDQESGGGYNSPPSFNRNPRAKNNNPANMLFWNEVPTIRAVGMAEIFAFWVGAKFILQEPGVLTMGRIWCDYKVPSSPKAHIEDSTSAYIHGAKAMMDLGIIRTVRDILKFGQIEIK